MQQRYYDPELGRFLSVDPVTALDIGDMRHFNRYAYAYNNPYKFTDPDGRTSIPWGRIGTTAAKGGARAGTAAIADGPEPFIGDAIGAGILLYTLGEIAYDIYQFNEGVAPPTNPDEAGDRIKESCR